MSELNPLVSVIVANFNGAAYLPALFKALRQQSLREIEVIVVDDASTDGSVALAQEPPRSMSVFASRLCRKIEALRLHEISALNLPEARGSPSSIATISFTRAVWSG